MIITHWISASLTGKGEFVAELIQVGAIRIHLTRKFDAVSAVEAMRRCKHYSAADIYPSTDFQRILEEYGGRPCAGLDLKSTEDPGRAEWCAHVRASGHSGEDRQGEESHPFASRNKGIWTALALHPVKYLRVR